MIYASFESILVLEHNGKQNPEEPYMNKYQKHIAYLGEDPVYNFMNNMIEESKYCSKVMKKI